MRLLSLSITASLLFSYHSAQAIQPAKRSYGTHNYYVLEHIPNNPYGVSLVDVAKALGVEIVEPAGELVNHWLVRAEREGSLLHKREESELDTVLRTLENLKELSQNALKRSEDVLYARKITSSLRYFSKQRLYQRVKRQPPPASNDEPDTSASRVVAERFGIHDPLFPDQWHLVNEVFAEHSMNVTPVWEKGITGKGIITAMVDDGVDYDSEDLKDNFVCAVVLACVSLVEHIPRMRSILGITTITNLFPHRNSSTTTMELGVPVKLPLAKIMLAEWGSPSTLK
jgi:kexin